MVFSSARAISIALPQALAVQVEDRLSGLLLPGISDLLKPPTVSANADDVSILTPAREMFNVCRTTLSLYEKASSVQVNY